MDMFFYTVAECNYLETLAKTFIIPARRNQFIQEYIFNNSPALQIASAMKTTTAFTGFYTENPLCYQHSGIRQLKILRGSQPTLDFAAADNCRYYVSTKKAITFKMISSRFQLIVPKNAMS